MALAHPKIIFGAVTFWGTNAEETETHLKLLEELGVKDIDCAEGYGKAEENLGKTNAVSRFNVDTKCSVAMGPDFMTKDVVLDHAKDSLRKLGAKSVDVYYLHAPDRRVPFEGSLEAMDILYRAGSFKRFGLSNYLPHEVEEVVRICKERDFVLPSVYQGNYSPIARRADAELFPVLRKHNIAFYAYSPLAGGFLTKTREMLVNGLAEGRWHPSTDLGKLYGSLYNKPNYLDALDQWGQIAEQERISKAELAYRWVAFNSHVQADLGDAVIFGAFKEPHYRETVDWLRKGPVSTSAAENIDKVWELVKIDAIWDNFNNYVESNRFKKIGEGW
ncbi:aldehyde reductase [Zopfia rhizophila CBS 207.26]|uniref:Aldehyde reductase n=1 Tax=Zopfia rhizophila CBS 207.26 TaxID=1314779 RepID=A0A6A6DHA1_9PEZI|nr:aldehyde reductase [Zopfia rhizophila CBS 207.26]